MAHFLSNSFSGRTIKSRVKNHIVMSLSHTTTKEEIMPTFGKKGKPQSGRRGRRVVDVETWPPEWKPLEECPQVKLGIISRRIYDLDLNQYDPLDKARIFIQQLRDSRGYEIEFNPPRGRVLGTPRLLFPRFWVTDPEYMKKLGFATNQINDQAKKHNEKYELVGLVRFVESLPHNCDFFTFNVRQVEPEGDRGVIKTVQAMVGYVGRDNFELMEWRFRPGPPLSPPPPEAFLDTPSSSSSCPPSNVSDSGHKNLITETPSSSFCSSSNVSDSGHKNLITV